jgi:hypothetical protein
MLTTWSAGVTGCAPCDDPAVSWQPTTEHVSVSAGLFAAWHAAQPGAVAPPFEWIAITLAGWHPAAVQPVASVVCPVP